MGETRRRTVSQATPAASSSDRLRARELLSLVDRVWPQHLPRRDVAGLPAWAADIIRPDRTARALSHAADRLDRVLPGWTEQAAEVVCQATVRGVSPRVERACALLAQRPLRRPERLLRLLDSPPYYPQVHFRALTALAGTDTAAVRAAWLAELRRGSSSPALAGSRAIWFALARAVQGRWLTFLEFRDCLAMGSALAAAADERGYRPALDRLGLWSDPVFGKWYRQVVYETACQPDASLLFGASGWIKDFPGEDYLFDALRAMERDPESWWPFHVLRWTSGVAVTNSDFVGKLEGFSGTTLCLLSLVRRDLSPAVGAVWLSQEHEEMIRWLTTATASTRLDLKWAETFLRAWAVAHGHDFTLAVGALCAMEPPPDSLPELPVTSRRRAFHAALFGTEIERAIENLLYVLVLSDGSFGVVCEEAEKGRETAVRALALRPDRAEDTAPLLFELAREGRRQARQAARDTLVLLGEQLGVSDLARLEMRVDLTTAWSEEGRQSKLARVWWDVGGYHVRMAVIGGKVKLQVHSGARQLVAIPARLRQDPAYEEIQHLRQDLVTRYRYFRRRFEQAMAEGVAYRGRDFAVLLAHPVVRSLVSRLMLTVDGRHYHWAPADPLEEGEFPPGLATAERVTIAHPVVLHLDGLLEEWQQRVVASSVAQPFKQAFREIYVVAEEERETTVCKRFAGRALDARRAFALLRRRGYSPRRGEAAKDLTAGVRAHIEWAQEREKAGKRLAEESEERLVTSGRVWFADGTGGALPLGEVCPIAFSETMRDADLAVSLAAFGEMGLTSKETRRLRATLVRYLSRAMGLNTVYISSDHAHALVEGKRAMYRVHLGSGCVLLEKSRRHLHIGPDLLAGQGTSLTESMDSLTTQVIGIILTLSQDDRITAPHFLAQLDVTP